MNKECTHETNETEIGYDIRMQRKDYYCTKCGKLVTSVKQTEEDWNKQNPKMKV